MRKAISLSRLFLLVAVLGFETKLCQGFVTRRPAGPNTGPSVSSPTRQGTLFVSSLPHELSAVLDPTLEAEFLTDMAHVAMDFSGFVFSPSRSLLRLLVVLGRIFAISADYVVDHSIHTEELMIQIFLICVTVKELLHDPPPSANNSTK